MIDMIVAGFLTAVAYVLDEDSPKKYEKGGVLSTEFKKILKDKYSILKMYRITKDTDTFSDDVHISDRFDKKEALSEFNSEKGIDDEYDSMNLFEIKYKVSDLDALCEAVMEDISLDDDDDVNDYIDEIDHFIKEDSDIEDYYDLDTDEVISSYDFKSTNDDSDDYINNLETDLAIAFASQIKGGTFSTYTNVFSKTKDKEGNKVSISVRLKDHSQRFSNIRSDYSISFVVANKDATGTMQNAFGKGFTHREIEAGDEKHAQVYFNSEDDYDSVLNTIIENINTQLEFALETENEKHNEL